MSDATKMQQAFESRGNDYDAAFATAKFYTDGGLGSQCHKAITLTAERFSPLFPGWPLYFRVVSGDGLYDRLLEAYAINMGRALSRASTKTGRKFIGKATRGNAWIRQASLDALDMALFGKVVVGAKARAKEFEISHLTYRKIRNTVGSGIWAGIDAYRSELHYQFTELLHKQKHTPLIFEI